ncbi:MAG: formyltetrahydrofolate deformylase, partial [Pseudomonadota bacterium]
MTRYILTLSCADTRGIVASVAGFLATKQGFIIESTQFGDPSTQRFFMRVHFEGGEESELKAAFAREVAAPFAMDWNLYNTSRRPRLLILV